MHSLATIITNDNGDAYQAAVEYSITYNTTRLPRSIYIFRLEAGACVQTGQNDIIQTENFDCEK